MDFKPFDKVIYRYSKTDFWECTLYSVFNSELKSHILVGGISISENEGYILPFEKNEYLVGTTNDPRASLVNIGEYYAFADTISDFKECANISKLANVREDSFEDCREMLWLYCIPYDCYHPGLSIKQLEKRIFKVTNEKVVPYLK